MCEAGREPGGTLGHAKGEQGGLGEGKGHS